MHHPVRRVALVLAFAAAALIAGACSPAATPPPTPAPAPASRPIIRQVLAGVEGDNNVEFVELFNPGAEVVDLAGYRLVYRLATSDDDLPVYTFEPPAYLPPGGSFLLTREGSDFPTIADAHFEQALNDRGGGLGLLSPDGGVADAVGWGNAPARLVEGDPAPAIPNGTALLRRQTDGGALADTGDNAADFITTRDYQLHNSGSTSAAQSAVPIELAAHYPGEVDPGQPFQLTFTVTNGGNQTLADATLAIPLPADVQVETSPAGAERSDGELVVPIPSIEPGDAHTVEIAAEAPWRFGQLQMASARLTSGDRVIFAGPRQVAIHESPIPISVARTLINQDVMVEGTATIYTGGLFAGSGNVKFYMSDPGGGVQVWVPSGEGQLSVGIGDRVRVRGRIERYRGTIELISEPPTAVEILEPDAGPPQPADVPLDELAAGPDAFAGELVRVEGELSRSDESTYGYDLELQSERGAALYAYIDKMTALTNERLELDQPYSLTGVLETPDGVATLYPRVEADLDRQFPPTVTLETSTPPSVAPGDPLTVVLTAANHTGAEVHDLVLIAPLPLGAARVEDISSGGETAADAVSWPIERLAPGAETEVTYSLRPSRSSGAIDLPAARLEDSAGSQVAEGVAASVYIGDSVPIHAVQGAGERSPFVGQRVQVEGAVTGVFPDLGGFYLEGMAPDADTATSEGVFVATTSFPQALQIGAAARAAGTIREPGHQTTIVIAKASDLEVTADGSRPPDVPALDPPSDPVEAAAYYEAMEGMLVDVAEPARAVGPTNQYGETPLVLTKHDLDRLFRGGPEGLLITVDDGSDLYHEDRSTMPYAASTGQQLAGVRGPLAFTFGQYKIEPVEPPQVSGDPAPAPQPVDLAQSAFSVMTWNAENLFDILEPNPSSPPRPHKAEYDVDLAKVAATIRLAGAPSVVALQEIENIGILQDLAALPELDPFDYVPYLLEGTDSRGIDVGYLVRGDAGEVEAVDQLPVPEGLTSRPPLELTLDAAAPNGSSRVVLLNNHFTALSAGVELTEPRRRAQAALNADAAAALLSDPAVGGVIVLGDLNSFYQDPSLGPLEQAGLGDALASLPGDQRYTYIFEGVSQVLDHIFLSDGLSSCLDDVRPLRADADFPPPAPTDRSALRKSDHDPLLAIFSCLP